MRNEVVAINCVVEAVLIALKGRPSSNWKISEISWNCSYLSP